MGFKKLLSAKMTFFLLLILLLFLGQLKFKQWRQQKQIDAEKQSLISQTEALHKQNQQLEESLSYLNSADFKERVARQQLNLKKEGEMVFGFASSPAATGSFSAQPNQEPQGSNFEKWVKYFSSK